MHWRVDLGLKRWFLVVATCRCDALILALGSGLESAAADAASFAADLEHAAAGSVVVECGQSC